MSSLAQPPTPFWILRHHSPSPVTALAFCKLDDAVQDFDGIGFAVSDDDEDSSSSSSSVIDGRTAEERQSVGAADERPHLLAGDSNGKVSLTSLMSSASTVGRYRPALFWQAHKEGSSVLGLEQWVGTDLIVTHGRDNAVRVWQSSRREASVGASKSTDEQGIYEGKDDRRPHLLLQIDVNALNFCRFSLLPLQNAEKDEALLAVPHTLESGWIDVYRLSLTARDNGNGCKASFTRVHSAIGKSASSQRATAGTGRAAIVMSMHLVKKSCDEDGTLGVVAGYEDGSIKMWQHQEGQGWSVAWQVKIHRESVLSTALSQEMPLSAANAEPILLASVAADDRLGVVQLPPDDTKIEPDKTIFPTSKAGRSSVALHLCGDPEQQRHRLPLLLVGGWDGRARLYRLGNTDDGSSSQGASPGTLKLDCIAVLRYHKESVQCVALATIGGGQSRSAGGNVVAAVGGKEGRVSLWSVDEHDTEPK